MKGSHEEHQKTD